MTSALGFRAYRVWTQLILLGLHVLAVVMIFRFIEDRRLAGVVAGCLFLEISLVVMALELKWGRGFRSWAFGAAAFFFVSSAVPVMVLRFVFWELPFDEIEVQGLKGRALHRFSNFTYIAIVAMVVVEGLRDRWSRPKRNGRDV